MSFSIWGQQRTSWKAPREGCLPLLLTTACKRVDAEETSRCRFGGPFLSHVGIQLLSKSSIFSVVLFVLWRCKCFQFELVKEFRAETLLLRNPAVGIAAARSPTSRCCPCGSTCTFQQWCPPRGTNAPPYFQTCRCLNRVLLTSWNFSLQFERTGFPSRLGPF